MKSSNERPGGFRERGGAFTVGCLLWASLTTSIPQVAALTPLARFQEDPLESEISTAEIADHIKFLSADSMKGREAGSEGAKRASDYIAYFFARAGLKPVGDHGTYFQNFELPRGFEVASTSSVSVSKGKRSTKFQLDRDFTFLSSSAPGTLDAEVVFAGYGIAAPDKGYDDYAGIDVTGKVVVVMRSGPRSQDPRGPFSSNSAIQRYCTFAAKLETAEGAGAAALLVINDPASVRKSRKDKLDGDGGKETGKIVYAHLTAKAGGRIASMGRFSLVDLQKRIDKTLTPASKELVGIRIRVQANLERKVLPVRNVVGLLKGLGQDKVDEVLVVGAHFDHVGLGVFGSRGGSSARGKVHNGADDNASGTAGMLEIAAFLAPHAFELRRDVLFMGFTAEEMGLLGSKHYVEKPIFPLAKTAAMINLDMVGRLGRNEVFVGGVGTSPVFQEYLIEQNRSVRVPIKFGKGGIAPTDSATFYKKRIPVLFFFTGLHSDYHRPADDYKRIDKRGEEKIVQLAALVALEVAKARSRPAFQEAETGGFDTGGPSLGLGIEQKDGKVHVATLGKRSRARKAGVRRGDRILELNGIAINTVSDYFATEADLKAGDKIELVLRRNGRLRTLRFTVNKS